MTRDSMDLICYKYEGWRPKIRPATPKRQWMDDTNERYAYRCLPLAIANSHGWELLSPCGFEARWDGGIQTDSVQVRVDPGTSDHLKPVTLFGYGTLTFHIEGIFRTPPGWNLYVTGPANSQKDAIQALSGVIETDWSPYTFTMNWRFTRADQWIRFEENEPIAFFFPVERGRVQAFAPRVEPLEENEELLRQFEKWSESRNAFQKWVAEANLASPSEKWQKLYYRGLDADSRPGPADHQSKLRVAPFKLPDGSVMDPPEAAACPVRHAPQTPPLVARAPEPKNVLFMDQGAGPNINALMGSNPGLAMTLERIGFDAKGGEKAAAAGAAASPDDALARKRRAWIEEAQARQRRLAKGREPIARVRGLSGADFLDRCYAPARPIVIEGAMRQWPALARWTPKYLGEKFKAGDKGRRLGGFSPELEAVAGDLRWLDDYLTRERGALAIDPAESFAPLRMGMANQLLAQVTGSRQVVLVPPSQASRLYQQRDGSSPIGDVTDGKRLVQYPKARGAETQEVTLAAGELLFVPLGWWHQERALAFSAAFTFTNFKWPNAGHAAFPRD